MAKDRLRRAGALLAGAGLEGNPAQGREKLPAPAAFYNYDGWGPFLNGPSLEQIDRNVDMFLGTALTTIMFSPNVGQTMCYPSEVSEFCHTFPIAEKDQAQFNREMGHRLSAGQRLPTLYGKTKNRRFWPHGRRSVAKGFETFAAFRMNDVHMLHLGADGGSTATGFIGSIRSIESQAATISTTALPRSGNIGSANSKN